tara:strand:+ start:79 stop:1428 length:1350 start_codon:yes stop_codon:yes gene_type:complete
MTTTRVTFENHGTEPVRVFWVNAGGLEQLIMPRIGPAQVMAMNASPGHELRCRGSLTSILLQVINVGIGPEQWVHVDQSGASQAEVTPTALPVAAVESDEAQEAKRAAQESDAVGLTSREIFAKYTPTHAQAGCEHPADVAEAASLAATPAPHCSYPLLDALPDELVSGGKLSSLQIESVSLACQRHLQVWPATGSAVSGTRAGFFLGDGAGVGKGRQLAAIVLDNVARGRDRNIWFSTSADLRVDAMRDLRDLGCHVAVHDGCQGLDKGNKGLGHGKEMQAGVLFSTYMTLVSATSGQKQKGHSRLQQIVSWCGGAGYEGCLLFDECHKARAQRQPASPRTRACHPMPHSLPPHALEPATPPTSRPRTGRARKRPRPRWPWPCSSCSALCRSHVSSTARPPAAPTSRTWPTWSGSGCGAPTRASPTSMPSCRASPTAAWAASRCSPWR